MGNRSIARWRRHWSLMAARDDARARNGYCIEGHPLSADEYRAQIIEPVIALLDLRPEHAVLDIGCGTGELLTALEGKVAEIVGTDLSSDMLAHYKGSGRTFVCDAANLPFTGETFDRIVMVSVAHYFPSRAYFERVVGRALRLLRPGGFLLIADIPVRHHRKPHWAQQPFAWVGWYWWLSWQAYPVRYLERVGRTFAASVSITPTRNPVRVNALFRR